MNEKNRYKVLDAFSRYDRFRFPCFNNLKTEKEKQDLAIKMIFHWHTEIDPVFNRDGLYWDRLTGIVWMEKFGRAFENVGCPWKTVEQEREHNVEQFKHDLEFNKGDNRLTESHYQALLNLSNFQKLPEYMEKMIFIESLHRQVRSVFVNASKSCNRILKKIKEEKIAKNE